MPVGRRLMWGYTDAWQVAPYFVRGSSVLFVIAPTGCDDKAYGNALGALIPLQQHHLHMNRWLLLRVWWRVLEVQESGFAPAGVLRF